MPKLTDTQFVILSAASQRGSLHVLPLPEGLKGGAAQKVIDSLVAKGLVEEIDAIPVHGDPIWRTEDDRPLTLVITPAGLTAIGIGAEAKPDAASEAPAAETEPAATKSRKRAGKATQARPAKKAARADTRKKTARVARDSAKTPTTRADSKQAKLIEMLKRAKGASIKEIAETFGWQHHTVRGAIAGALKKKLRLEVTSEKDDRRGRVYRIG